jgi:hypothetical protein
LLPCLSSSISFPNLTFQCWHEYWKKCKLRPLYLAFFFSTEL